MAISTAETNGNRMGFYILSSDIESLTTLAKEKKLWQGSWAYCVDNGATYMWNETAQSWVEQ